MSDTKVVELGKQIDPNVVEIAQDILALAKRGDVVDLAVVGTVKTDEGLLHLSRHATAHRASPDVMRISGLLGYAQKAVYEHMYDAPEDALGLDDD